MTFANEPEDLQPVWAERMNRLGPGVSSWTDAYLAAFAAPGTESSDGAFAFLRL